MLSNAKKNCKKYFLQIPRKAGTSSAIISTLAALTTIIKIRIHRLLSLDKISSMSLNQIANILLLVAQVTDCIEIKQKK